MFTVFWRRVVPVLILVCVGMTLQAAPYAAVVMDARDGRILHAENADARLHPASLTKMMTLYLVFEALQSGRLKPDQMVTISANAAAEPPTRLGLRAGQKARVMDLVRAAAVKSANDAATALGEAVGGSEREFGRMMTARAAALGMRNSSFRNAHGLSLSGHYSSARDMAILGRRLFYDFPQYYPIFGRTEVKSTGRTLYTTNRMLQTYRGADGIKTGYTNAAGYNLVASAERGEERVIAVVFGGRSSRTRNARVAELLDLGFRTAPAAVAVVRPRPLADPAVVAVQRPRPRGTPPDTLLARSVEALGNAVAGPAAAAERPAPPIVAPVAAAPVVVASAAAVPRSDRPRAKPFAPIAVATKAQSATPARAGWAVQLGAFKDKTYAQRIAARMAKAGLAPLRGAKPAVTRTQVSGVTLYRARLTGLTRAKAEAACDALRARNQRCQAVAL